MNCNIMPLLKIIYSNDLLKVNKKITEEIVITNNTPREVLNNMWLNHIKIDRYRLRFSEGRSLLHLSKPFDYKFYISIKNGLIHNDNGPALLVSEEKKGYKLDLKIFAKNGVLSSDKCITFYKQEEGPYNKYMSSREFSFLNGQLHSYNGMPAYKTIVDKKDSNGASTIDIMLNYYKNGFIHNVGQPATVWEYKYTTVNNNFHFASTNIRKNQTYYFNNHIHNLDGPAIIREYNTNNAYKKSDFYYIFGKKMNKKSYLDMISNINVKKEFELV